jgi:hypothetical protein
MHVDAIVSCECGHTVPLVVFKNFLAGKMSSLKCSMCGRSHKRIDFLKDEGFDCVLCGHTTRYYRRKLNSGMARSLFELWSRTEAEPDVEWWHHREFDRFGSREIHKLVHWGLVQEKPKDEFEDEKRSSGFWRITDKGSDFAQNKATVPKFAILFQNRLEKLDGEPIKIADAFGEKFKFEELMAERLTGST